MIPILFGTCSNCDTDKVPITNKTHYTCEKCTWERNHPGQNWLEHKRQQASSFNKSSLKPRAARFKSTKTLNQVSAKEKKNKEILREVYAEIDATREHICSGCGQSNMLSHSHLLSRNERKDLEAEEDNIVFDCLQREIRDEFGVEGCHSRWESMNIEKMSSLANFEDRLKYIRSVDEKFYNKIMLLKENG